MPDSNRQPIQLENNLKQLREHNQRLSAQVKQLVKTESELHASRNKLDSQIRIYRQLYEIGKQFNNTFDVEEILGLIPHFVLYELNFERCLILSHCQENNRFLPLMWDGYYEEQEVGEIKKIQFDLSRSEIFPLFSLAEYLMCAPDYYHSPNLQKLCSTFGMEEYVLFALAIEQQKPEILLLVGNTANNAQYHSRIEPEGDFILGLANLVSQASIAIKQCQLYKQVHSKAHELEQTISKLGKAQSHLIQTEKMSSLGQLVAGIAHEINNPVNFIFGNLIYASEYTKDVLELLHLYQKEYPQFHEKIQAKTEEIDLSFIEEDLNKLLQSMHMGASRIRDIVLSLRNFSRLDESHLKKVDIHSGLDSTLMILQNRLKVQAGYPVIQVIKEYDDLPLVECYAGQLNQVFMNILNNAIDALEKALDKGQMKEKVPTIWISTKAIVDQNGKSDRVAVNITDNGTGMAPEVQQKVFDPFFTTKPIGQGTGLAMSISFQVVTERHGGFLKCTSSMGEGTEFVVEIPCKQRYF